jgi:hypothetical protein
METIVERPGALDVHKQQVTACDGSDAARLCQLAEAGRLRSRDALVAARPTPRCSPTSPQGGGCDRSCPRSGRPSRPPRTHYACTPCGSAPSSPAWIPG